MLKQLLCSVATTVALLAAPMGVAETLNVAVAANFAATFEEVAREFERATGHGVNVITGASGSHYAQIISGAPFDLFLSADAARPLALEQNGIIGPGQRRAYARGRLALWSRDPRLVTSLEVLSTFPATARLAIANPRLAPYGQAAVETLQFLGLYARLQGQLVMGENVGQAFQFAYTGSAMLGIVAYAQVLASPVPGSHVLIPDHAYQPVIQEMALLRPGAASSALFEYLSGPAMAPILERAGYYSPTAASERP